MEMRIKEIVERCEGSILDIGCVQHTLERVKSDSWLHGALAERFNEVMGIDILQEEIKKLQKMGYNVRYGNAENFELNEKFNTIVAGELIEHLSNPGKFLDCCRKHLKDDEKLILTTPNPHWIEYTVRRLFKKLYVNPEHTALYDEDLITHLAERHHFKVIEVKYIIERSKTSTLKGFIWHKIVFPILSRFLPEEFTANRLLFVIEEGFIIKDGSSIAVGGIDKNV